MLFFCQIGHPPLRNSFHRMYAFETLAQKVQANHKMWGFVTSLRKNIPEIYFSFRTHSGTLGIHFLGMVGDPYPLQK